MSLQLRRRTILLAALGGAAVAALGITVAAPHAGPPRNGLIAVGHHTHPGGHETSDVATVDPVQGTLRLLTASAPGGFSDDPAWDGHGNRIYFDSDRAGHVHLFAMNGEGHDVKQLFDSDGFEFTPTVSDDGKLLAFEHDNGDFSAGGIYVGPEHGRDLAEFRQVTTAPGLALGAGGFDGNPDISPDGTRIAFVRVLDTTHGAGQSAVFVVGVDGTGLTRLTPYDLDAERPSWSPDGSTIAFATNSDNFPTQQEIDTVPADGGPIVQLTHDPLPVQNFGPNWSPDGTRIVFDRWMGFSHFDLMAMSPDGSGVTTLHQGVDGSFDFRPAWGSRP